MISLVARLMAPPLTPPRRISQRPDSLAVICPSPSSPAFSTLGVELIDDGIIQGWLVCPPHVGRPLRSFTEKTSATSTELVIDVPIMGNGILLHLQKPCQDLGCLSHWPCNANLIGLWQAKWWHDHPSNAQIPWHHFSTMHKLLHFGTCGATYQEKQLLTNSDQLP